jgi:hypothetical protein
MFDQRLASAAMATARIRLEALVKHLQKINLSPFFITIRTNLAI